MGALTASLALPRPRDRAAAAFGVAAVSLAGAAGLLADKKPVYGVGLAALALLGVLMAASVTVLPVFLVLTMFVESLSLGHGLTIGRAGGILALLLTLIVVLLRGVNGLRVNALLVVALLYGVWIAASSFWSEFQSGVATDLGKYALVISYSLAFAVLLRSVEQARAVFATFAVGAFVFGVLAVLTFAAHHSSGYRASGLQGDPNTFALYQVIALPATLVFAALVTRPGARQWAFATVGVIVLSVAATVSRTGIVALLAVVLLTLFLPWRVFFSGRRQKLTYTLAIFVSGFAAAVVGAAAFATRQGASGTGNRGSGRIDLWTAAWHAFTAHPLLGIGAGNFQIRAIEFLQATPGVDSQAAYLANIGRVVHNTYLETLTELGVVGLALFLSLIGLTGWSLLRSARRARAARHPAYERFALATASALVAYAVAAFFLSIELNKPFWILAGLALALDVVTRDLAPVPAFASVYPPAMSGGPSSDRERRLEALEERLAGEERRLEERRNAVSDVARELRERVRGVAERERAVAADREDLKARLAAVEQMAAHVAERLAQLERRERALGQAPAAAPAAVRPATPPPVAAPPPPAPVA
ncbi:MAG: O-antigen ligase family protein, partial [Gaiellaceae bacterium]